MGGEYDEVTAEEAAAILDAMNAEDVIELAAVAVMPPRCQCGRRMVRDLRDAEIWLCPLQPDHVGHDTWVRRAPGF